MDAQPSFLNQLFDKGFLVPSGVDGLYGRGEAYEDVITAFDNLITKVAGPDKAEKICFPPGMSRTSFEKSGYLKSFPQLAGTVHSFCGVDHDHTELLAQLAEGEDWTAKQECTDVVLTPAACYPIYPVLAARGNMAKGGALFDLQSYCFRHEPSQDPARMQLFRIREFVRAGTPEEVVEFREEWLKRGPAMMESVGLPLHIDLANDPFFGRGGRLMKVGQREQQLKFELLVQIANPAGPTAIMSFNYHQDHFGETWGIHTHDGAVSQTACTGFGMDRIALALLKHHGLDLQAWPKAVRKTLWG
jgi:seryl-tRNA synthetase